MPDPQTDAQLAEDDAGILAAAVALAWDNRAVVTRGPIDQLGPEGWWQLHSATDQRRYLRQARTACSAWENFWKERGR
jgi:hypothetical protein